MTAVVQHCQGRQKEDRTSRFAADLGYEAMDGDDEAPPSAYARVGDRVLVAVTTRLSRRDLGQRLPEVPERTLSEVLTRLTRAKKLRRCNADGTPGNGHYEPVQGDGRTAAPISGRPAVLPNPEERPAGLSLPGLDARRPGAA
jgi:hypothetical protein